LRPPRSKSIRPTENCCKQIAPHRTRNCKPLRLEEISPEEARRELLTIMPAPAIEMLLKAWAAALGHPALVTSTVADITGTPARTYRDWVTDHVAEFRA